MKKLEGRVAVVTGGASGIGRGMADVFAAEGMKLVIADVERSALDKAVAELQGAGAGAIGVECDVSKPESVQQLCERTLEAYGAVHVLCNNAGVGAGAGPIWENPLDDWSWVMGVNLMGVVYGIQSFVPVMLEQGDEGHVVNTASMAGLLHGGGIYGVTKHGVVALSETLFRDLQAHGATIGVSVLCPGWVNTRILESERNRPEAPREDPGERAAELEMIRKVVEGLVKSGLDPREVGGIVRDAILESRFYVLTHPTWKNMIRNRMETILEDRDPIGVAPEGQDWSQFLTPPADRN